MVVADPVLWRYYAAEDNSSGLLTRYVSGKERTQHCVCSLPVYLSLHCAAEIFVVDSFTLIYVCLCHCTQKLHSETVLAHKLHKTEMFWTYHVEHKVCVDDFKHRWIKDAVI